MLSVGKVYKFWGDFWSKSVFGYFKILKKVPMTTKLEGEGLTTIFLFFLRLLLRKQNSITSYYSYLILERVTAARICSLYLF